MVNQQDNLKILQRFYAQVAVLFQLILVFLSGDKIASLIVWKYYWIVFFNS